MSSTVIHRTRDELLAQREALIAEIGLPEDRIRELAEDFLLYPEHYCLWATVEGIDYLLGADE